MGNNLQNSLQYKKHLNQYEQWVYEEISTYCSPPILELGCGLSTLVHYLPAPIRYTGVDSNVEIIQQARSVHNKQAGVDFKIMDITATAFQNFMDNNTYQTVVCLNILEHLQDDRQVLKNIYNGLKEEGRLLVQVPAYPSHYGANDQYLGHARRYTKNTIRKRLQEAGFMVQKIKTINLLGALIWFLHGRVFGIKNSFFNSVSKTPSWTVPFWNQLISTIKKVEGWFNPPYGLSIIAVGQRL